MYTAALHICSLVIVKQNLNDGSGTVQVHSIITAKESDGMTQIDADDCDVKERVGWIDGRVRDSVGLVKRQGKGQFYTSMIVKSYTCGPSEP